MEISGKGTLLSFTIPSMMSANAEFEDLMPFCYGCVEFEEGAQRNVIVRGVSEENKDEIRTKLPLPVEAEIIPRDGYRTVVCRILE